MVYDLDVTSFENTLNTWRSMLKFEKDKKWLEEALLETAKTVKFKYNYRMLAAMTLFNSDLLETCYEAFLSIAESLKTIEKAELSNTTVPMHGFDHNVIFESCLYLLYSDVPRLRDKATETLMSLTSSQSSASSSQRYDMICSLDTNFLRSAYNTRSLRCDPDPQLLYKLFSTFFGDKVNGVRERILCAEKLLVMETPENRKVVVLRELLDIAKNGDILYNARADAVDVVIRNAKNRDDVKTEATKILQSLSGSKNIYQNAQNVHADGVANSVNVFVEKLIVENGPAKFNVEEYNRVVKKVWELSEKDVRSSLTNALKRVDIDAAQFSSKSIDLKMLLVLVYRRIVSTPKTSDALMSRLIEELVDMGDTCSSGHLARFVNVFTGFEKAVTISFAEEIRSNFSIKMMSKMKAHEKHDYIMRGSSTTADQDDRAAYTSFLSSTVPELKKQLFREFVESGLVPSEEFYKIVDEVIAEW